MLDERLERYRQTAKNRDQIVSVFMLTYNREHYLKIAIESVRKQTYQNFQLIVLDNCSEDHTEQMVTSIADDRITYIKRAHEPDCSNSQFAMRECVTKYIIILHDDDIVCTDYLEEMVTQMESGDYAAASSGSELINSNGDTIGYTLRTDLDGNVLYSGHDYLDLFLGQKQPGVVYPSVIYRCDFFKTFYAFDSFKEAGPARDTLLFFETERAGGKIYYVNKPLIRYRIHQTQDSNINAGYMELQLISFMLKIDYYEKILRVNYKKIIDLIWNRFLGVTYKYCAGKLGKEKYQSFLQFQCIDYVCQWKKGQYLRLKMKFIFRIKNLVKVLYRIKHRSA